jgi:hypothetical protein
MHNHGLDRARRAPGTIECSVAVAGYWFSTYSAVMSIGEQQQFAQWSRIKLAFWLELQVGEVPYYMRSPIQPSIQTSI